MTNAHVVAGAQRLQVEVPIPVTGTSILATRSRTMPATIVGIDAETDLAVFRVSGPGLAAAAFGDSESLRPGQLDPARKTSSARSGLSRASWIAGT